MDRHFSERLRQHKLNRRDFLWLATVVASGPTLSSCTVNPVTGESQLILMSESQEIQIDLEQSPHQFSADYGVSQDQALNQYLSQVGNSMASRSHRPQMPYSFRTVNANYINAYAFPGGSIAATRGILLELENEAELSALLGHELGHVNARHSAQRQSKGMLANAAMMGVGMVMQSNEDLQKYTPLAMGLGSIGTGALLAHYSRDNEREADALGMRYMTMAEQNPSGMVNLMDILRSQSKHKPNAIQLMFATHPMSEERFQSAKQNAESQYSNQLSRDPHRDRYMDHTAHLRRKKAAIQQQQQGEEELSKKQLVKAQNAFASALKLDSQDYTGNVLMAKTLLAQKKPQQAKPYIDKARSVYPNEAQAKNLQGITLMALKQFDAAYSAFDSYEKQLPGNPNTIFLKGNCLEAMQKQESAAHEYQRYLQQVNQGEQAQYAYQRLVDWGYLK